MKASINMRNSVTINTAAIFPVTIFQVLMGKFLACFSLYAIIEIGALSLLGVLSPGLLVLARPAASNQFRLASQLY